MIKIRTQSLLRKIAIILTIKLIVLIVIHELFFSSRHRIRINDTTVETHFYFMNTGTPIGD